MKHALDWPGPGTSLLGGLDPRWKLAALGLSLLPMALLRTLPAALTALAVSLAGVLLAPALAPWLARRLAGLAMVLVLFVVWLPFVQDQTDLTLGPVPLSTAGLFLALTILVKALALVALILLVLASSPLEDSLKAAHALYVPGLFVQLAALSYRYLHLLGEEFRRLRIALRTRGFRARGNWNTYRTLGHAAGCLLVRSQERADRVSQAMRCRGFDGRFRSLTRFRTRPVDLLVLAFPLLFAALLWWDRVYAP